MIAAAMLDTHTEMHDEKQRRHTPWTITTLLTVFCFSLDAHSYLTFTKVYHKAQE